MDHVTRNPPAEVDSADLTHRAQRTVAIEVEHLAHVQQLIERVGLVRACKILGLSRTAILGMIGTGRGMAGTASLLREALSRRGTR